MSLTHENLTKLGSLLNYDNLEGGLCAGFSGMWCQSVLVKDEAAFLARLDLIEKHKENFQELVDKINAVKKKSSQKNKSGEFLSLSEEENQLLSVLSLYDGISLYLNPDLFSDTFGPKGAVTQNDLNEIFSFTKPNSVDGDINVLLNKPFIFNDTQLKEYLNDLQNVFIGSGSQTPLTLTFVGHEVALRYDEGKNCWFYLDTNHLGTENFWLELSSEELAQELHTTYTGDADYTENVLFTTTVLSLGPNEELSAKLKYLDMKYQANWSHTLMQTDDDANLFRLACRDGDVDLVRRLIMLGAIRNDEEGINRALVRACYWGNVEIVRELIKSDLYEVLNYNSALPNAVNSAEVVQELLKQEGVDINQFDEKHRTPLARAIDVGSEEVVRLLILRSAIDSVDLKYEMNSMMRACRRGNIEIVGELFKYGYGTDLDKEDINGYTALHFSCEQGDSDIVAMLLTAGAELTHKNKKGYTPLDIAIIDENDTVISVLLETIINQKLNIEEVVSSENVERVKYKIALTKSGQLPEPSSPEPSINITEPAPSSQKVQQPPEASFSDTMNNILKSVGVSLAGQLKSTYTYGEDGGSRIHFNKVNTNDLTGDVKGQYVDKDNKPLIGDGLKRAILDNFKEQLEKCTTKKMVEDCVDKLKRTGELTILATHQRPQTLKFKESKTSAIQALETMCSDAQQILNPKAEFKKEAEPTNHDSMGFKK